MFQAHPRLETHRLRLRPFVAEDAPADVPLYLEVWTDGDYTVSLDAAGRVTTVRSGTGNMVCIADPPDDDTFDARCYHRDSPEGAVHPGSQRR